MTSNNDLKNSYKLVHICNSLERLQDQPKVPKSTYKLQNNSTHSLTTHISYIYNIYIYIYDLSYIIIYYLPNKWVCRFTRWSWLIRIILYGNNIKEFAPKTCATEQWFQQHQLDSVEAVKHQTLNCQTSAMELLCENSQQLKTVTHFRKKLHHRSLSGF